MLNRETEKDNETEQGNAKQGKMSEDGDRGKWVLLKKNIGE